jgi:sn-glycerol 3-phosphate transport system ATP-binding protein
MATLDIQGLRKNFGPTEVLRQIDLSLADGEMLVIVGASGCGKSTLLRLVAGLETPSAGRIVIGGRDVTALDPSERDIAMVFQNYALYPHMSVFDNMAYGLRIRACRAARSPARSRTPRRCSAWRLCWPASRGNSPAASGSAWRWAAPSCAIRNCSCSTSHCPTWTPSCACRCVPKSASCSGAWASPACM